MSDPLRALILGSGFAGQGHALALRDTGVEIVGMAGRTRDVVEQVAASLDISYASTDWKQALAELQPDIVAVATPGGAHFEPVMAALAQGCHIYCDKPLAATAVQAKTMVQQAKKMGVKTAYTASYRYQPYALLARELVAAGTIGEPQEVECISHFNLDPLIPFGWSHRLDQGGGRLNNNFTHKLSIVLHILNGTISAVNGETRNDMPQAPVVSGVHDFRERQKFAPKSESEPGLQWKRADAEWSYTVMGRITPAFHQSRPVSALFKHSGLQPRFADDYIAFYGDKAAIYIKGHYAQGPLYLCPRGDEWQEIPLPAHITDALPNIEDDTQRNWTQMAREFVADIRGQGKTGYQTFQDGWIYQEVIEAIRVGQGGGDVPTNL